MQCVAFLLIMGACCSSDAAEYGDKVFNKDRRCTDLLCLILFLVTWAGMVTVAIVSFTKGNPDRFMYPTDYLGQFCGKTGTDVAHLPYAFYPRLNQDVQQQWGTLLSGRFWNFRAYTLCVDSCPVFALSDPAQYGGPGYPGVGALNASTGEAPLSYYAQFDTRPIAKRCFPIADLSPVQNRLLCGVPCE